MSFVQKRGDTRGFESYLNDLGRPITGRYSETNESSTVRLTGNGLGEYKELAPIGYDKEAEEKGVGKFAPASYPHYLPTWGDEVYPPLEPFQHHDHGLDADPAYPELLAPGVTKVDLTPLTGSEITGVQLSKLSNAGRDQLARFVAERKVVAFRDQDLADLPINEALEFGRYFGRLHVHPTSGAPAGYPEVHLVHRGVADKTANSFFETRTSSVAWHSDVTYEQQPPGTTFLYVLDIPETGGDTLFANGVEAYNRLSDSFKERLHGLKATHSGIEQINASRYRNGAALTRNIVGFKKEESDLILNFLYDHIALGADFHARVKWAPKTVVVWDNRVATHTALVDWQGGQRRHLARITPQAEAPFETPFKV
ncbi:putative alpha-ketoglutarate-dependent taurine dioxygenase protein [Rutstroemia sp. NJR-2017a BVV2]|nr:putative alpha-ketoglutarate-dependent taurine dioxygenase protein [Rutstroemia sp. NJR-2017a BVV2]